jgi:hypothetical protein
MPPITFRSEYECLKRKRRPFDEFEKSFGGKIRPCSGQNI